MASAERLILLPKSSWHSHSTRRKPLSIKPAEKAVLAVKSESPTAIQPVVADITEKKFSVADRLNDVLSFIDSKYKKKVPIEIDSEYTRSNDSLKLLISGGWEFTTRIRHDSLIGREVRDYMESNNKLDLYGKWYMNNQEYGGDFQIIGRRITRHNISRIILYLSTRKNHLSAQQVIDERSTRWRIENLFKNVDIDATPGNNDHEITGYYTLAFFMAELSIASMTSLISFADADALQFSLKRPALIYSGNYPIFLTFAFTKRMPYSFKRVCLTRCSKDLALRKLGSS